MGKPKVRKPKQKPNRNKVGLDLVKRPTIRKEAQTKFSPFDALPNEILEEILTNLPLKDKKSARLVCLRWINVLKRSFQFKLPLTKEILIELGRRDVDIHELEVVLNRVPQAIHITKRTKASFLTTKILSFMADSISNALEGAGVVALVQACENINTLKFDFRYLHNFTMPFPLRLKNTQLQNLKTLQLKLAYGGVQDVSHEILKLKMPQLRNLDVERFKVENVRGSNADRNIYLALQLFMIDNHVTHKSVKLINIVTNITLGSSLPAMFPVDMLIELGQLKLDSLEINHRDTALLLEELDTEDWPAANELMSQSSLTSMKLDIVSVDIIRRSHLLLLKCTRTLTELELNIKGAEGYFATGVIRYLTCLTKFTFTCDRLLMPDTFLPRSIKFLTWNAPVHAQWYSLDERPHLPVLVKFTIGVPGPDPSRLEEFCHASFGTVFIENPSYSRTKLQAMILDRKPQAQGVVETRSQFKDRNMDLAAALRLPKPYFLVEFDQDKIRISAPGGVSV